MMMTTNQLAEATNLAPQTLLNYVKEGIIKPDQVTPDGRYYFNEELVPRLLLRKSSIMLKNATLIVIINNEEERLNDYAEKIRYVMEKTKGVYVGDLLQLVGEYKSIVQEDADCQRAFMKLLVKEIKDLYQQELSQKQVKLEGEILVNKDFTDIALILNHREQLFVFEESANQFWAQVNEKDRSKIERYRTKYKAIVQNVSRKYDIADIKQIEKQLADSNEAIQWEPKTGTAKGIYAKVQQKNYRLALDNLIRTKLSKGYFSLLKVVSGDEDSVYRLLKKAVSSEFRSIEIFGFEKATPEEQQVIRFLQEIKHVTIHEQRQEETL